MLDESRYKVLQIKSSEGLFTDIRALCLADPTNKLRENYSDKNLIIERHDLFTVIMDVTLNQPVAFSGVYNGGRFPPFMARFANRAYVFPAYRAIRYARKSRPWVYGLMLPAQLAANPASRKLAIISAEVKVRGHRLVSNIDRDPPAGWQLLPHLMRVSEGPLEVSMQRIAYKNLSDTNYLPQWQAQTMTDQEWLEQTKLKDNNSASTK